jgi:hypothetical protein
MDAEVVPRIPMIGLSRAGRIAIDLTFALMLLSGAMRCR